MTFSYDTQNFSEGLPFILPLMEFETLYLEAAQDKKKKKLLIKTRKVGTTTELALVQ